MKAFEVEAGGKKLDYRVGQELDLDEVRSIFERDYVVEKLWQGGRHVLGHLKRDEEAFFLKIATTEGIGALSQTEAAWNDAYHTAVSPDDTSSFRVPSNRDQGFYQDQLFYLITDRIPGQLLADRPEPGSVVPSFTAALPGLITFTELIQDLSLPPLSPREPIDHQAFFLAKAHAWYGAIPQAVREQYRVSDLLTLVQDHYHTLEKRPRHGDFTPWHVLKAKDGTLGLIDGEHALSNGVQYYDIAYLIQRVFSVIEEPVVAEEIVALLKERNYDLPALRTVLAARGIGGYLDESLKPVPSYSFAKSFQDWVETLDKAR